MKPNGVLVESLEFPVSRLFRREPRNEHGWRTGKKGPWLCPWVALVLAIVGTLFPIAAATPEVSLLGTGRTPVFEQGVALDVALTGDVLVVALDGGMATFDAKDPAHLKPLGGITLPGTAWSVQVQGSLAYVAAGPAGLHVVDISEPARPVWLGSADTPGQALEVVVSGQYAYLADDYTGLQVVDVADPSRPRPVGSFSSQFNSAKGLVVVGKHVYIAAGPSGLAVVDITDPPRPRWVAGAALIGTALKVALLGETVWVATGYGGLEAVSISDPRRPVQLGRTVIEDGYVDGVTTGGQFVYASCGDGGFQIFDGSVATNLVFQGSLATSGQAVVAANHAYIADRMKGLVVANVGNPTQPTILSSTATFGEAVALESAGDWTYIANFLAGLSVVNTSDPDHPKEVASYAAGLVSGIALADSLVYLATDRDGLQILDVSIPTNPRLVGQLDLGGGTNVSFGVTVNGAFAYVSTDRGVEVVNVSTPATPVWVGGIQLRGRCDGMVFSGNRLYVAESWQNTPLGYFGGGLEILDVSDPTQPKLLGGFYETSGYARTVAVAGDRAYLADGYAGGVQILDVNNAAKPVRLGRFDTPGAAWGVTVVGSKLYVSDGEAGILLANVSDPTQPVIEGSFPTGRFARQAAVTGSGLQVAAGRSGLFVVSTVPGLQLGFRVESLTPGTPCVIYQGEALGSATPWTPRYTNATPSGPFHFIDYHANSAASPQRFYRASQP